MPALINKVLGQLQIALVLGHMIELDQGQLDLLMAAVAAQLARAHPKHAVDVISVFAHRI